MTQRPRDEEGRAAFRLAPDDATMLHALRRDLLRHHRTSMTVAQHDYERAHGRVEGPGQLLHLLMQNPEFGWLRKLSGLIARLDERVESPAPGAAEALIEEASRLLLDAESGDEAFHERYHRALQDSPDVVVTHGIVAGALRKLRGARFDLQQL